MVKVTGLVYLRLQDQSLFAFILNLCNQIYFAISDPYIEYGAQNLGVLSIRFSSFSHFITKKLIRLVFKLSLQSHSASFTRVSTFLMLSYY